MSRLIRWIRAALGIAVVWGLLWVAIGVGLTVVFGVFRPDDIGAGEGPTRTLPILGLVGFWSGLAFAGVMSLAERRTELHELSLARVALWGLAAGAGIPLLMGTDGSMGWLTGLMGSVFATASVAIARRGAHRQIDA